MEGPRVGGVRLMNWCICGPTRRALKMRSHSGLIFFTKKNVCLYLNRSTDLVSPHPRRGCLRKLEGFFQVFHSPAPTPSLVSFPAPSCACFPASSSPLPLDVSPLLTPQVAPAEEQPLIQQLQLLQTLCRSWMVGELVLLELA